MVHGDKDVVYHFQLKKKKNEETILLISKVYLASAIGLSNFKCELLVLQVFKMSNISYSVNYY